MAPEKVKLQKRILELENQLDNKFGFENIANKSASIKDAIKLAQKVSPTDSTVLLEGETGDDFDKAFIEMMIPHHQGAIEMAEEALESAKHQEIKDLATDIIEAQQREIDMMNEWYKSWGYEN